MNVLIVNEAMTTLLQTKPFTSTQTCHYCIGRGPVGSRISSLVSRFHDRPSTVTTTFPLL